MQCRNARFEGPKSGGESAGPGPSDAGAAHQGAASQPASTLRPPAADAAPFTPRGHRQGGAHFLPKNHRQHAHGESALRHVQELSTVYKIAPFLVAPIFLVDFTFSLSVGL